MASNGSGEPAAKRAKDEGTKNSAFVFIKPHAVTPAVQALVLGYFAGAGIKIVKEGSISSEDIDKRKLIDQHYYAIASKATILKPAELNVPADKFKQHFGLSWEEAKEKGLAVNAMDACSAFGVDGAGLEKLWRAIPKEAVVKFGGGFYCAKIESGGKTLYVFNGFFMAMRGAFTVPGKRIHYYTVEFDPAHLSWADFRGKVLGTTDPAKAPADSLRGIINARWKELGLEQAPNTGDNGVHASASPFEGMAERNNWLGEALEADAFGKRLLAAGVPTEWLTAGCVDPHVKLDASGKMGSLFDAVEDTDAEECFLKLKELAVL